MVHIGVMALNEFIEEALVDTDFYFYGEIEAIADTEWDPLERIARDFKKGLLGKRAARSLFKKAIKAGDHLSGLDTINLEDAMEQTPDFFTAYSEAVERIYESGFDSEWTIYSDVPVKPRGTSINPFDYIDWGSRSEVMMAVVYDRIYFLKSDNIIEGYEIGQSILSEGKQYPVYEVTLRPSPKNIIGEAAPTYGPPRTMMRYIKEHIEDLMYKHSKDLMQVLEEGGA